LKITSARKSQTSSLKFVAIYRIKLQANEAFERRNCTLDVSGVSILEFRMDRRPSIHNISHGLVYAKKEDDRRSNRM